MRVLVLVAALGHASRTKNASRGSVGAGSSSPHRRLRLAAQPVAPVPVLTIRPELDWRSARPWHSIV